MGRRTLTSDGRAFLLAAVLATIAGAVRAAEVPPGPDSSTQRVDVTAQVPIDDRRDATASKVVVTREDLARYGDTSLAQSLQRISGVTVVQSGAKGAEIRLRGLGAGYTQILVDGEPVPAGFSIESLSPDLIDHVDVIRSATADLSTQAIAGTINIVLRHPARTPPLLKLSVNDTDGRPAGDASFDASTSEGAWNLMLGARLGVNRSHWRSRSTTSGGDVADDDTYRYRTAIDERQTKANFSLLPKVSWKSQGGDVVSLSGLLQHQHTRYGESDGRVAEGGTPPDFASDLFTSKDDTDLARATLEWKSAVGADASLDSKLVLSANGRRIGAGFTASDAGGSPILSRDVASTMHDDSLTATGKLSIGLGDNHTLGVGWDGQMGVRTEDRVQHEQSQVAYPTLDLDEAYRARIERIATYVQDEWTVDKALSAYGGVRWEGLHIRTSGNDIDSIGSTVGIFSPTLQAIWKIPDTKSDQVRVALGRTYKAPTPHDLVPRLWVVNQNGPTAPDFRGNPALKPELSWGLDVSYERYLPGDGLVTLNAYSRRIEDVVVQRVDLTDGLWIQTPQNAGSAEVEGLGLEVKTKLATLVHGAPDVDLRLGTTRNWSHLNALPGPGNRLTQQPTATASLGADWRLQGGKTTLGASFVFERGGYARTAQTQSIDTSPRRLLDMYARWALDKQSALRATVTNALALNSTTRTRYFGPALSETDDTTAANPATFGLQYETRF